MRNEPPEQKQPEKLYGDHPLAHRGGIDFILGYLVGSGAMCPKCGYGTRKTSKRWARCKKCNERVPRGVPSGRDTK